MADSSYEKGLSELSKMKVADLKAELKQRGLPTTGNKNDLVERLQLAINGDSSLSLDETTDEILDEDAVLGDEEIEELSAKPDSQDDGEKSNTIEEATAAPTKKIILNRNPVIEEIKVSEAEKKEENTTAETTEDAGPPRKIIKLSELGVKERLEMRAKKFGIPLSDAAKKEARSARFNTETPNGKNTDIDKSIIPTSYETLKKRAERFGTNASSILEKAEMAARIEKRKARFGEVKPLEKTTPNRVKIVK